MGGYIKVKVRANDMIAIHQGGFYSGDPLSKDLWI